METFTILNYQGSKKKLIKFIHDSLKEFVNENDVIFDIFCGTSCVSYSYKKSNIVYANDCETYAKIIAGALLGKGMLKDYIFDEKKYYELYKVNCFEVCNELDLEKNFIDSCAVDNLINLYKNFNTVWNTNINDIIDRTKYQLFLRYYSTSYFGINQAVEIDSIRQMIEKCVSAYEKDVLLACLFFAMKECVFSKDGHMAQPLNLIKNKRRLLQQRGKSIYNFFINKLSEFTSDKFIHTENDNKIFNLDFEKVINNELIIDKVTVIYADPPYTDMQYSRYYHLLNTVAEYNYPSLTENGEQYTKGLYLNNRFQSKLSKKSTCLTSMQKLIGFSKKYNKTLVISFAYPQDKERQKTDRYVMNIDELIRVCVNIYGKNKVYVKKEPYEHSNNRNSETKKVLEYLIICERENCNDCKY